MKIQRKGRPRKTTTREDKLIIRMSKSNPRLNSVQIHADINTNHGLRVSSRTVQRRLCSAGLNGRRPVKKPLISLKNKQHRLEWAKERVGWTAEQWRKVLWSDESKFNLFGNDGIQYVRRPVGTRYDVQYQLPTVKHGGGSVMVWGAFHAGKIGPLYRIHGKMDRFVFKNILKNVLVPFIKQGMPRGWMFQQDNAPKDTAGICKDFIATKNIRLLEWPSQSPDLNPVEHLWEELARRCRVIHATNADEKFLLLQQKWSEIPIETLENLVDSMPRRCEAVIKVKGNPMKY